MLVFKIPFEKLHCDHICPESSNYKVNQSGLRTINSKRNEFQIPNVKYLFDVRTYIIFDGFICLLFVDSSYTCFHMGSQAIERKIRFFAICETIYPLHIITYIVDFFEMSNNCIYRIEFFVAIIAFKIHVCVFA